MTRVHRRRIVSVVLFALLLGFGALQQHDMSQVPSPQAPITSTAQPSFDVLETLAVKGRAPKTGYSRDKFGNGWATEAGCDVRNTILARDLVNKQVDDECKVLSGTLHDPYTGGDILFTRGATTSDAVQIDHVVALSNAWQTGAQQMTYAKRVSFANDPLNLLAVEGRANQQKSDGDAATWLPANKQFRCTYVRRQVDVKARYSLWVTAAEKAAIKRVLTKC